MDKLTARTIGERLGYSSEAIRQWKLSDYTPETVAQALRERAGRKQDAADSLHVEALKMNKLALEIERQEEAS